MTNTYNNNRRIFKFEIAITDEPTIVNAPIVELCHVGTQNGRLYLWAEVDDGATEEFPFYVVGTGNPVPDGASDHIGTAIMGSFVWHVYTKSFWSDLDRW